MSGRVRSGSGSFRRLAAAAAVLLAGGAVAARPPTTGPAARPVPVAALLGVNLEGVADWAAQPLFADVMKQGRPWSAAGDIHTRVPVDAGGWPEGDASIVLGTPPARMARSTPYKLSFKGNAALSAESATIQNNVHDAATNTTTADVHVTSGNFILTFRGQPGGVKNVKLMRPGHAANEIFSKDLIARLSHFSVVRFMQALGGGGSPENPDVNWSDRTPPGYATQVRPGGIAWEYVILLANQGAHDVWINIPLNASDDYITALAQLFRYGSDGVKPYTSPQANPVYPPLDPSRMVYLEYVNELWNGIYRSTRENTRLAKAEVSNGDPNHLAFKSGSDFQYGMRRMAYKIVRISDLFRSVFGDEAMMTRIRPVLAGQVDNLGTLTAPLEYLEAVYGPGNRFGNPGRPVNHYIHAGSGAPYIGLTRDADDLTVDGVFAQMEAQFTAEVQPAITSAKKLCDRHGIKLVAYEGGQHLVGPRSMTAKIAAQDDPRMKNLLVRLLRHWSASGGDLFAYYSLCSGYGQYGSFGLSNDITTENTPKWEALKEFKSAR